MSICGLRSNRCRCWSLRNWTTGSTSWTPTSPTTPGWAAGLWAGCSPVSWPPAVAIAAAGWSLWPATRVLSAVRTGQRQCLTPPSRRLSQASLKRRTAPSSALACSVAKARQTRAPWRNCSWAQPPKHSRHPCWPGWNCWANWMCAPHCKPSTGRNCTCLPGPTGWCRWRRPRRCWRCCPMSKWV